MEIILQNRDSIVKDFKRIPLYIFHKLYQQNIRHISHSSISGKIERIAGNQRVNGWPKFLFDTGNPNPEDYAAILM
jgi:hypothetical protein